MVVGTLAGCTGTEDRGDAGFEVDGNEEEYRAAAAAYLTTGTLYKAPNCSCCLEYAEYLEETGDVDLEIVEVDDLAETKAEFGVPENVESCHTLDTGEYFVEGHVPVEAIGKLAHEEPPIVGIALPEMPIGSPGMPGEKAEDFVIYGVDGDGEYTEFLVI